MTRAATGKAAIVTAALTRERVGEACKGSVWSHRDLYSNCLE